jgi:hypothetical protein
VTRTFFSLLVALSVGAPALGAAPATRPTPTAPGVVVTHVPAATGTFVGSPSLAVLPDGTYLGSHDLFGPRSNEHVEATSRVFRSVDRGATWTHVSDVRGAFWSTLFVHRGDIYLLGTTAHHGDAVVRRSRDGGRTWTTPADGKTGLLLKGQYHCAPVPVVEHAGRLWRAIEDASGGTEWGKRYKAMMLSVPADADLLDAAKWTASNAVARDPAWLGGRFNAWLEGNAVVGPDGKVVDVLRVDLRPEGQTAAIVRVSDDGKTATFDPANDFVPFPGGSVKFTIRWDPASKLYWSLTNDVPDAHAGGNAASTRNTLALIASPDLRAWAVRSYLLYHPDVARHGFQYVDWLFDGDDLIALCRTAYDEPGGGAARNFHDANYLTVHRVEGFRRRTMADSVPIPKVERVTIESADWVVTGTRFDEGKLADGATAFANRPYVWAGVPAALAGCRVARPAGGVPAAMTARAKRSGVLTVACTPAGAAQAKLAVAAGWTPTGQSFHYTDGGRTPLAVYARPTAAGEAVVVPQAGWAGTIVLLPVNP